MSDIEEQYLILTPAGVLQAFSNATPNEQQQALQDILTTAQVPLAQEWQERYSQTWLSMFIEAGWVEIIDKQLLAPHVQLDTFLPYVVASLSGSRRAIIGSEEKLCLARIGFTQSEADKLCVAASDFFEFLKRQQQRGWVVEGQAISFFNHIDMLMPATSFTFLWINGMGYWLVLEGEPLLNNRAFIELVWGIKANYERTLKPVVTASTTENATPTS